MSKKPHGFFQNPNVCTAREDRSGGFQELDVIESADYLPWSLAVYQGPAEMQNAT
jgi:hypothetical protein